MKVFVDAIGFAAPGMEDWESARRVLRGEAGYEPKALSLYQPNLLPPNERRRAAPAVRLAFRIAEDAMRTSSFKPSELATVFATSDADTSILHRLCTALAQPQRAVSPTDFHNSVHNAAAGYWSIAAGAKPPSTSLSAYDASFAAGLLEAATFVVVEQKPVLLACYDVVPPQPLFDVRPIALAMGVALVLAPDGAGRPIEISGETLAEIPMADPALEKLRLANPAGRALPLLQSLARA
ncbi:MAG TPA: beta-ketoacyl synthase chain length factor [Nevskiaceae bacterium]|nr:beta-ketoacyl synthase chain length factor [Nevskiaceae bacterium]